MDSFLALSLSICWSSLGTDRAFGFVCTIDLWVANNLNVTCTFDSPRAQLSTVAISISRSPLRIHNCLTTPSVPQPLRQKQSKAAGGDMTAPLCSAQGRSPCKLELFIHYGSQRTQRNVNAVKFPTIIVDQARAETVEVSLVTSWSATRWKRVQSSSNISVGSSLKGVRRSSVLSSGVSPVDETHSKPSSSSVESLASITSSTHGTTSVTQSAQCLCTFSSPSSASSLLSTFGIPQTPFSSTHTETLVTEPTISSICPTLPSSSASPIITSWGLSSSFFVPSQSTAIVITPRPSPSFTMSDPDTITLTPVNPTSIVTDSTNRPGTTPSGLDTTPTIFSSISSIPSVIPTATFLSTTFISPIPSTASSYPSISAISLSSVSTDDPTITPTSTSLGNQITIISSVVQTGVLSTDTPHNTGFAHQTGPIIGVALAGTFVLFLIVLLLFFACKRHRSNRSYNSSMDDILAVSRNTSWYPPLEGDDDEDYLAVHGRSMSAHYPNIPGHSEGGGFFGDHLSVEDGGSGSGESAGANGVSLTKAAFGGGQPRMPPVSQTFYGSTNSRGATFPGYASYDGHDTTTSRPWWWSNTEPLNIHKRNSPPRRLPLTVDSHMLSVGSQSTSSLAVGGGSSSDGPHGSGSSREAFLPRGGNTRNTSITGPKPIHKLSGRKHYSTPPTAFVLGRDSNLEQEQGRVDKSISQVILARLRASRRPSTSTTVEAYSQCSTIRSEESVSSSRAPSYIYSSSLLNPPISTVPRLRGVAGNSDTPDHMLDQHCHYRQGVGDTTSEGLMLTRALSPVPTDTSSMVEGLLHPRLGIALAQSSQQASVTSFRDHEDYTRPINGLVNNHIQSTTTFQTQDTVEEGGGRS